MTNTLNVLWWSIEGTTQSVDLIFDASQRRHQLLISLNKHTPHRAVSAMFCNENMACTPNLW